VVIAERRLVAHTRPVILATHSGLGDGFLPGLANLNDEEAFLFSDKLRVDTAPLSGAGIRPRTRIAVPNILPTGPDQMPPDPMAAAYKIPEVIGAAGDLQLLPSFPLAAAWLQQDPQLMAADWPTSFCTPGLDKPCPETVGDLGLPGESQTLADNIGIVWRPRTGPQGRAFDHVSASLLVADRVMPGMTDDAWKKKVRGKVAIVGRTDVASKDFFVTGHRFPLYAHADCPGMSIQAEIVDNLLRGQRIRYAPDWIVAVLSLFIAGLIIGIGRRLHGGVHILASLGVVVAFIGLGCAVYALTEGTVIEPRLPLLAGWIGLLGTHWKHWLES